jgi:Ca2+-binding RTX toxin-like protein
MMQWTISSDRTTYETERYNFFLMVEEGGGSKLPPYDDRAANPNMTIGVGMNLHDATVRAEVIQTFGLIYNNAALSQQGQAIENRYIALITNAINAMFSRAIPFAEARRRVDAAMRDRANDTNFSAADLQVLGNRRMTFAFNNEDEIKTTFQRLMDTVYEPLVNRFVRNIPGGIPDSTERVVLASLAYNSRVHPRRHPRQGIPTALGPSLERAILNGDRAEAWYEIRYGTNPRGTNMAAGIAKRRYVEADTFGLYDASVNFTGEMDEDNARRAWRTYTRHKPDIDSYERDYSGQIAQGYIDYGHIRALPLAARLQPARDYLVNTYALLDRFGFAIDGDIKVGEDQTTLYFRGSDDDSGDRYSLVGGAQNDLMFGESGRDTLDGRDGRDVLYGGVGDDTLIGGRGDDVLIGGPGHDLYLWREGDGHDIIRDEDQSDPPRPLRTAALDSAPDLQLNFGLVLYADASGNYQAFVGGSKTPDESFYTSNAPDHFAMYTLNGTSLVIQVAGAEGSITIENFQGGDFGIWLRDLPETPDRTFLDRATDDDDYLVATLDAEEIDAQEGDDIIYGLAGSDRIEGGMGNDGIWGHGIYDDLKQIGTTLDGALIFEMPGMSTDDDDWLYGGSGNDQLSGDEGDDWLYGGTGNDQLGGVWDNDVLYGEEGNDWLIGDLGDDQLFGGPGQDTLVGDWEYNGPAAYVIYNGQVYTYGPDSLDGGADNDSLFGVYGDDTLLGGEGNDVLWGDRTHTGEIVAYRGNDFLSGGAGLDQLIGDGSDDTLFGGADNDILWGDTGGQRPDQDGNDYLDGGAGDDQLRGEGGADVLLGDIGNDELHGGAGNDTLSGGAGQDLLWGDTAGMAAGQDGNDSLDGGDGDDQLVGEGGDDTLFGGTGNDVLQGDEGDDQLTGGAGTDQLLGRLGNDTLDGETGDDLLWGDDGDDQLTGGDGTDQLVGGLGNDTLLGDAGNDALWGDDGDDVLEGGDGTDQLTGGAGSDTFIGGPGTDILLVEAQDQVVLTLGDGEDHIKLETGVLLPTFSFVDGLSPEALQFSTGVIGTDPAQYLILTYGTDPFAPDQVVIQDGGLDLGQTYTFGDTTLTQRALMQYATVSLSLRGNASSNSIYGGTQGDFLYWVCWRRPPLRRTW